MKVPTIRTKNRTEKRGMVAMEYPVYAKVRDYCKARNLVTSDFVTAACVKAMNDKLGAA